MGPVVRWVQPKLSGAIGSGRKSYLELSARAEGRYTNFTNKPRNENDDTSPSFPLPGRGGEGGETGRKEDFGKGGYLGVLDP